MKLWHSNQRRPRSKKWAIETLLGICIWALKMISFGHLPNAEDSFMVKSFYAIVLFEVFG